MSQKCMNYGNKVIIKLGKKYGKNIEITLRNVTEIHYHYPSPMLESVAFESNIHGTGITYPTPDVKEFETSLEKDKAKEF